MRTLGFLLAALLFCAAPAAAQSTTSLASAPSGGYIHGSANNPAATVLPIASGRATLGGFQLWNGSAATQFIQIFDLAVGNVTLGTTLPDKIIPCPTLTYCFLPISSSIGSAFINGISFACTTTALGASGCASAVYAMWDYR